MRIISGTLNVGVVQFMSGWTKYHERVVYIYDVYKGEFLFFLGSDEAGVSIYGETRVCCD